MGKTKSPKQKTEKKSQQQQVTKKKSFKEKVKLSQQYQSKHKITKKKSNIKTTTSASFKSSLNKKQNTSTTTTTTTSTGGTNINEKKDKSKGLSNLQQSFQKKLEGARFRVINERLYTSRGHEAFEEFQRNKTLFDIVSILFLLFVDFLPPLMG